MCGAVAPNEKSPDKGKTPALIAEAGFLFWNLLMHAKTRSMHRDEKLSPATSDTIRYRLAPSAWYQAGCIPTKHLLPEWKLAIRLLAGPHDIH
jgi:hypothetical protein